MLRHVFRLVWNRKRTHALILVELAIAFLIVFFVAGFGSHLWHRWQQPLGFEWHDTYELRIETSGEWTEEQGTQLRALLATLRDHREVEWAHFALPPFRGWRWTTNVEHRDRKVHVFVNRISDGGPEDFGVELLEGRFFNATDYSETEQGVLVDERLAAQLFPDGFEPGADIRSYDSDGDDEPAWKVVGVFRAFRQQGELSPIKEYVITRFPMEDLTENSPTIQIRVPSSAPVDIEQRLQLVAERVAPTWTFTVTPLSKLRERRIREAIVPLAVAFWVAVFLLAMVAFGLFGVLWQSVTRRTDELGLRRALGGHRGWIYRLVVAETLVLALLAALLGSLIAIQFPITGSVAVLDWRSSLYGLGVGLTVLLGLAGLCSLYPAWLAARRSPAEALHYE